MKLSLILILFQLIQFLWHDNFSVTMTSLTHSQTYIASKALSNPYDNSHQPKLDESQNQNV